MTQETFKNINEAQTVELASAVGQKLKGGEIIELVGDVGAGKTTFVKGLAKGLDSSDRVSSPTYVIEQIYKGRVNLHHFDFYRLNESGIIKHTLQEALKRDSAAVIEWANTLRGVLPTNRLIVNFAITSEKERDLTFSWNKEMNYLEINK